MFMNTFNINIGFNDILNAFENTSICLESLSFFKVKEKEKDTE